MIETTISKPEMQKLADKGEAHFKFLRDNNNKPVLPIVEIVVYKSTVYTLKDNIYTALMSGYEEN